MVIDGIDVGLLGDCFMQFKLNVVIGGVKPLDVWEKWLRCVGKTASVLAFFRQFAQRKMPPAMP